MNEKLYLNHNRRDEVVLQEYSRQIDRCYQSRSERKWSCGPSWCQAQQGQTLLKSPPRFRDTFSRVTTQSNASIQISLHSIIISHIMQVIMVCLIQVTTKLQNRFFVVSFRTNMWAEHFQKSCWVKVIWSQVMLYPKLWKLLAKWCMKRNTLKFWFLEAKLTSKPIDIRSSIIHCVFVSPPVQPSYLRLEYFRFLLAWFDNHGFWKFDIIGFWPSDALNNRRG